MPKLILSDRANQIFTRDISENVESIIMFVRRVTRVEQVLLASDLSRITGHLFEKRLLFPVTFSERKLFVSGRVRKTRRRRIYVMIAARRRRLVLNRK